MNDRITRSLDVANLTVTFECNGNKIVLNASSLSAEVKTRAMLHGLNQTIGDAAAIETKEINGKMHRPTCREKLDAMQDRINVLMGGKWSDVRATGGKVPELLQVLMNLTGKTLDDVREDYEGLSKEERKALRDEPAVATEIIKLRAGNRRDDAPTTSILAKFRK